MTMSRRGVREENGSPVEGEDVSKKGAPGSSTRSKSRKKKVSRDSVVDPNGSAPQASPASVDVQDDGDEGGWEVQGKKSATASTANGRDVLQKQKRGLAAVPQGQGQGQGQGAQWQGALQGQVEGKVEILSKRWLFVAPIHDIDEEIVRSHFIQYGEIARVECPTPKKNQQKPSHCFLLFKDPKVVQKLIAQHYDSIMVATPEGEIKKRVEMKCFIADLSNFWHKKKIDEEKMLEEIEQPAKKVVNNIRLTEHRQMLPSVFVPGKHYTWAVTVKNESTQDRTLLRVHCFPPKQGVEIYINDNIKRRKGPGPRREEGSAVVAAGGKYEFSVKWQPKGVEAGVFVQPVVLDFTSFKVFHDLVIHVGVAPQANGGQPPAPATDGSAAFQPPTTEKGDMNQSHKEVAEEKPIVSQKEEVVEAPVESNVAAEASDDVVVTISQEEVKVPQAKEEEQVSSETQVQEEEEPKTEPSSEEFEVKEEDGIAPQESSSPPEVSQQFQDFLMQVPPYQYPPFPPMQQPMMYPPNPLIPGMFPPFQQQGGVAPDSGISWLYYYQGHQLVGHQTDYGFPPMCVMHQTDLEVQLSVFNLMPDVFVLGNVVHIALMQIVDPLHSFSIGSLRVPPGSGLITPKQQAMAKVVINVPADFDLRLMELSISRTLLSVVIPKRYQAHQHGIPVDEQQTNGVKK